MFEPVRCPSCSSRYGLKPERVRPGIRRARCFRCQSVFGIEPEVQRLLQLVTAPEPSLEPTLAPTPEVVFEPMPPMTPEAQEAPFLVPPPVPEPPSPSLLPPPEDLAVEELAIGPDDFGDLLQEEATFEAVPEPATAPLVEPTLAAEPASEAPQDLPPSLTLGDLEGSEDEILEKTLVVQGEAPVESETAASTTPAAFQAEPTQTGGFSSARDAIFKLLGDVPAQAPPIERRTTNRTSSQMDVDAALDALDNTLGGNVRPQDLGTNPGFTPPPVPPLSPLEEEPSHHTATTKMSHEELMAAMAAAAKPAAPAPAPAPVQPPPPPISAPTPRLIPPVPEPADASLYKVQLPKETAQNLSLETLLTWIEQGHVQEYHMVARQQSENWIEASKVPALRMAFDRLRRSQAYAAPTEPLPSPHETAPVKRSLFGGLFGRN